MSAMNRRQTRRYTIPPGLEGRVEFGYPTPADHRCNMAVRDVSDSGVSFALEHELPGLEVGRNLDAVTLRIGECEVHGELVITHLTREEAQGSVCGALFLPATDADIVRFRKLINDLEAGQPGEARSA